MATVNLTGFESGVLLGEIDSNPGTVAATINTATVRTGTYSCNAATSLTDTSYITIGGITAAGLSTLGVPIATSYVQFWFRFSALPALLREPIYKVINDSGGVKAYLKLSSTGKLEAYNFSNVLDATGATTLVVDTWYRIEFKCSTGVGATAYEVRINGNSEISDTMDTDSVGAGSWQFGRTEAVGATNSVNFFYDDIYISDSAFLAGNVAVKVMYPDANGSTMSWTSGTGASDYTQVDTIPVADAEYVMSPTTGNPNVALFDLISTATAGISNNISSVKGYIRTRENTSVTSATFIRIHSGSSDADSSTRNGTTTVAVQAKIADVDPATSAAWTSTALDAVEVGAVENNAVSTRCSSALLFVAYLPATSAIKTVDGLAIASVKTFDGLAIASVKTINGLA